MYTLLTILMLLVWAMPAAAEPVTFATSLHAKFHHARCLTCHQFNTYKRQGLTYTTHRSRYLCAQCHRPDLIGSPPGTEWMAPSGMDYTGFSAAATCRLIKQRIGIDPDGKKLAQHLLADGRIQWAFDSGMTPGGQRAPVPGGYDAFRQDVEVWIKDGMRCE